MEIRTKDYDVWYDAASATVHCAGFLRLDGVEGYKEVLALLLDAVNQADPSVTIDLRDLEFLNSSGISMLSMFVIRVREKGNLQLSMLGSERIPWQTKSLRNLKRLMPSINLEFH